MVVLGVVLGGDCFEFVWNLFILVFVRIVGKELKKIC